MIGIPLQLGPLPQAYSIIRRFSSTGKQGSLVQLYTNQYRVGNTIVQVGWIHVDRKCALH
jgi:hypothetical protein